MCIAFNQKIQQTEQKKKSKSKKVKKGFIEIKIILFFFLNNVAVTSSF